MDAQEVARAFATAHTACQAETEIRGIGAVPSWVTTLLNDLQTYGPEVLAVVTQLITLFGGKPPVLPPVPVPATDPLVDPNA